MEHTNLSLEYDRNLIDKILDDLDMRYIILFLYVIRNDLFKDLTDNNLIESYERILILDEIYKSNITKFWQNDFIEIAIDLGLFKNIRSLREFDQKDDDFTIKLGDETITIEKNIISVPEDTLFLMLNKKLKFLTRRNFNLSLIKLKGVRCESTNTIHSLVYEIGEHDYAISDDLYYILDEFGNVYQTIKIEIIIEGFDQRFKDIHDKVIKFINFFEPSLNSKLILTKIYKAIEEDKDIINFLKDQKVQLPSKFNFDKIDTNNTIFKHWYALLIDLLNYGYRLKEIKKKLQGIKNIYSGKKKKYSYLKFIEKVSYNDNNIVNFIQESLLNLRGDLIQVNNEISKLSEKQVKLLNLDYERFIIINSVE